MRAATARPIPAAEGRSWTAPNVARGASLSRQPSPPQPRADRRAAERARLREERRGRSGKAARQPVWQSPAVLVTAAAALAGVLFVAYLFFSQRAPVAPSDLRVPATEIPASLADGAALGPVGAPVTMEVFSDFQCPACGRLARESLPRLVTDFVAPGTLRVVSRDIAILDASRDGGESTDAAAAAACAEEQGSYWPYHDWLFANQRGENEGRFGRATLVAIADRLGLDRAGFEACLDNGAQQAAVGALTRQSGVTSTPTISLNGQRSVGLPAYDDLAAAIRATAAAASAAPGSASPGASP